MRNFIKNIFKKQSLPPEPVPAPKPKKEPKAKPKLSPKEEATANGEPYVAILSVDIDPANINNGSFDLDWNDKFVLNLIKAGYKMKAEDTDNEIVDRWFTEVCRNVVLEMHEQYVADPTNREVHDMRRISQKDLGGGRTEVS